MAQPLSPPQGFSARSLGAAACRPDDGGEAGGDASPGTSDESSEEDDIRETTSGLPKPWGYVSGVNVHPVFHGKWIGECVSIILVLLSMILTTMLTVPEVAEYVRAHPGVHEALDAVEVCLGGAFALEYVLRALCAHMSWNRSVWSYVCSWEGGIDLLAAASIMADVDGLFDDNVATAGRTVNFFWLLRLVRVLKFLRYLREMNTIASAVAAEKKALFIFMLYVFLLCFMFGTFLYFLEKDSEGFDSIPLAVWCIIVTITTVGYGDMVPQSILGRLLICFVMLLGYSTLAVPTIVGVMDVFGSGQKSDEGSATDEEPSPSKDSPGLRLAESSFLFTTRMPLRPWDCDRWGFLNSVTYHQIFEAAVFDFFSQHTVFNPGRQTRPLTVKVSCDVLAPLSAVRAGGDVVVGVSAKHITFDTCSLVLGIFPQQGGPLKATGDVTLRWVRATSCEDSVTSASIPHDVRSALETILPPSRVE